MDAFGLFEFIGRKFTPPEQASPESVYRWRGTIAGGMTVLFAWIIIVTGLLANHLATADGQYVASVEFNEVRAAQIENEIDREHLARCRLSTLPPPETAQEAANRQDLLARINTKIAMLQAEHMEKVDMRYPLDPCDLVLIKSG